jgi:hypothetical protein
VSPQLVDFVGDMMSCAICFMFAPSPTSVSPPIATVRSVGPPRCLRFFRLLERMRARRHA